MQQHNRLSHTINALNNFKQSRLFVLPFVSVLVLIFSFIALTMLSTDTQAVGTYRNWNDDAIVRGGSLSEKELLDHYDKNTGGMQSVYKHYGISRTDLTGKTSDIKHGTIYQDGRVVVDGKTVATDAYSVSRTAFNDKNGNAPKKLTIDGTTYYEGPNMSIFTRTVDAYVLYRDGKFYRAIISSCSNPVVATPNKPPKIEPKEEPAYSCDLLEAKMLSRFRYEFDAKATAKNGAKIINYTYDFGDGNKRTQDENTIYTYKYAGTYTAKVTVNVDVDGKKKTDTNTNCEVTIRIEEEEKEQPIYRCENLRALPVLGRERTYGYTLTYTAENGAKLDRVVYNFGDGQTREFSENDAKNVQYQYDSADSYTTTATLYFDIDQDGKITEESDSCTAKVSITKKTEVCEYNKNLDKDDEDCKEPEEVEPTQELPKTGLSEFLMATSGLGSLSAGGYYWNISRKHLKKTLLSK